MPQPSAEERPADEWGGTSREALEDLVANGAGTVTLRVTPAVASCLLERNVGNRPLRPARVAEMADTIRQGRYVNTGEPIIMSAEGVLNNGQHRLSGVVEAGIAVEMDVRFGIPRRAFAVTDTHAKRSAADVLGIGGEASSHAVAAAARLLVAYQRGLPAAFWRVVHNDEILEFVEAWPLVIQGVRLVNRTLAARRGFVNASSSAFGCLAILQAGEEAAEEFLRVVESGAVPDQQNPARLLREKLLTDQSLRHGSREQVIERLALFIKAWNAWRAGDRPARLFWRGFGDASKKALEPFPLLEGVKLAVPEAPPAAPPSNLVPFPPAPGSTRRVRGGGA